MSIPRNPDSGPDIDTYAVDSAYISGLVIGIELALMYPIQARPIVDNLHTAAATNDEGVLNEDLRDDLYDTARSLAIEIVNGRLDTHVTRAVEAIERKQAKHRSGDSGAG